MEDNLDKDSYESYMEVVKRSIGKTKELVAMLPKYEWIEKLSYEQWVDFQEGKLKMFDPLSIEDVRESRVFNYYFEKGEIVKLDVELMDTIGMDKYSDLIGLHAVVTDCYSDLHSFGRGSSYSHHVKFENGYETKPCGCAFPDMVPTWLLIPITSEESQKYIDIYKNTEDKDSLWFYIK
jgi:hypothetical protein